MLSQSPLLLRSICICAWIVALTPGESTASCNVIPGASDSFRSALGSTDRPFVAPGDFLEVQLEPRACLPRDRRRFGTSPTPGDVAVTIVFDPPGTGATHAVIVVDDCAALDAQVAACGEAVSGGAVCVDDADLGIEPERLSFRFPNTDALAGGSDDLRTLSGPARVAVTRASSELPCGALATGGCSDTTNLLACIDEFYELDGTCEQTNLDPKFGNFVALPLWNDYQAMCGESCGGTPAAEVRFTTDAAGNALIPVDWQGILVRGLLEEEAGRGDSPVDVLIRDIPFPRFVHGDAELTAFEGSVCDGGATPLAPCASDADCDGGSCAAELPVKLPGASFLSSHAPNGVPLPPLFAPLSDLDAAGEPGGLAKTKLFGASDAPLSVMRIARRSAAGRRCVGGQNAGLPCNVEGDCGEGGACGDAVCVGGADAGSACTLDGECAGGTCGAALFDFSTRYEDAGVGPLVVPAGDFEANAEAPIQIDALVDTDRILAFPVSEALLGEDLNGDGDEQDVVVQIGSSETGLGRENLTAVTLVRQLPHLYTALAAEGSFVAYLEPEPGEGDCDAGDDCDRNDDGDTADVLLRVARRTETGEVVPIEPEPAAGCGALPLCADPEPIVQGRSLMISDGLVFFRADEPSCALRTTELVSIGPSGDPLAAGARAGAALDVNGERIAFVGVSDEDGVARVMVRNQRDGTTEVVSVDADGVLADADSAAPLSMSDDGTLVAFHSRAALSEEVPADGGASDYFVRDLDSGDVIQASVELEDPTDDVVDGEMGEDGRFVVFSASKEVDAPRGGGTVVMENIYRRDLESGLTDVVTAVENEDEQWPWTPFAVFFHATNPSVSVDGEVFAWQAEIGGVSSSGSPRYQSSILVKERDGDRERPSREAVFEHEHLTMVGGVLNTDGEKLLYATTEPPRELKVCPGDREAFLNAYVFDNTVRRFERVSVDSDGEPLVHGVNPFEMGWSADERFVAFSSYDPTVNPATTPSGPLVPPDLFDEALTQDVCRVAENDPVVRVPDDVVRVFDRLTGIAEVVSVDGAHAEPPCFEPGGNCNQLGAAISGDGRTVAFPSYRDGLDPRDDNGELDVFVRSYARDDAGADFNCDDDSEDTVLMVIEDAEEGARLVPLGAAGQVAVSEGNAAFLAGDDRGDDLAVHLYRNRSGEAVEDLGLGATAVALSTELIGAIASETGTAHVSWLDSASPGSWQDLGVVASDIQASGPIVAFSEPTENPVSFNLYVYRGDQGGTLFAIPGPRVGSSTLDGISVREFVLGPHRRSCFASTTPATACTNDLECPGEGYCDGGGTCRVIGGSCTEDADCASGTCETDMLLAFRSRERDEQDLNRDGDNFENGMLVYDLLLDRTLNSSQAAFPCKLQACDPRSPYRIVGDSVQFVTLERQQGESEFGASEGIDLDGDGNGRGAVLQLFSPRSRRAAPVAEITPRGAGRDRDVSGFVAVDPLAEAPSLGSVDDSGQIVLGQGVCLERIGAAAAAGCPPGATVVDDPDAGPVCVRNHGTCLNGLDCPFSDRNDALTGCSREFVNMTSADRDGDSIPDRVDNCPDFPSRDLRDFDADGIGNVCDGLTCGDRVREAGEDCDDGRHCLDGTKCREDSECDHIMVLDDGDDGECRPRSGDGCDADCAAEFSPIVIDIEPRDPENRVGKRTTTVALLGSEEVDIEDIVLYSLRFGPSLAPTKHPLQKRKTFRKHARDLNGDGFVDLLIHFRTRETGLPSGESEACLEGEWNDPENGPRFFQECDIAVAR